MVIDRSRQARVITHSSARRRRARMSLLVAPLLWSLQVVGSRTEAITGARAPTASQLAGQALPLRGFVASISPSKSHMEASEMLEMRSSIGDWSRASRHTLPSLPKLLTENSERVPGTPFSAIASCCCMGFFLQVRRQITCLEAVRNVGTFSPQGLERQVAQVLSTDDAAAAAAIVMM